MMGVTCGEWHDAGSSGLSVDHTNDGNDFKIRVTAMDEFSNTDTAERNVYIVGAKDNQNDDSEADSNIDNQLDIPTEFDLLQNYPNPFNPSTAIGFEIPNTSSITLTIYDLTGREVENLVDGIVPPGAYTVYWDASEFPSGVYFYTLVSSEFTETQSMILSK
jgi:hypothetical protein